MKRSDKFSDDFSRDGVAQITRRGRPVSDVSERLGVGQYFLGAWKKNVAKASSGGTEKDAEIRRLERELLRVAKERDIPKRRPRISAGMRSEAGVRGRASRAAQRAGDVPLPPDPAERVLHVARGAAAQAGARGAAADRDAEGGPDRKRPGL